MQDRLRRVVGDGLMPKATHRLDVLVVPTDPDCRPDGPALLALAERWRREPSAIDGGFGALRVDLPGRVMLYANQLGGFRVRCPESGDNVVPAFSIAFSNWKRGGSRDLQCPACGTVHPLEALDYLPDAAYAPAALVFADAAGDGVSPALLAALELIWGPSRLVLRRPV